MFLAGIPTNLLNALNLMFNTLENAYRRGIRWSLAGSVGAALFQFLQMAVFARLAGPAALGDYALAATCIGFLMPLAEAGLGQALVQARDITPRQLVSLGWLNMVLGASMFVLVWWLGPFLGAWYGRPELAGLMVLMGLSLLFSPLGAQGAGLLHRDMQFDGLAKVETLAWASSFVFVSLLAWLGWGAWAMGAGFVLRNALNTTGFCWLARAQFPADWRNPAPLRAVGPLVRFGLFDLASRWTDVLSNYLDKMIVGKWLGVSALGYYNLAFTFLMLPTARLGYVITRVGYPVFARIRDDTVQLQAFFGRMSAELTLVLFPVYAGLALFSREIVTLIFGADWLPAAPLFVAFSLAGLVRAVATPFPQLLQGLGRTGRLFAWNLFWTLGLNGMLVLFLWWNPGILQAAWSRAAAAWLFEIPLLWWLAQRCGLRFGPLLQTSGRAILYLWPVVVFTLLAGWIPGSFGVVFALKIGVFLIGMAWFGWKSPMREVTGDLVRQFGRGA